MTLALKAPVFVVGAPFSGDALLVDALSRASGVYASEADQPTFLDALPDVDPARHGWHSHRLASREAEALGADAAEALAATLHDREGRPPLSGHGEPGEGARAVRGWGAGENARAVRGSGDGEGARALRAVAGGPRLALRVPLLASAFSDARFVMTFREPQDAVPEMVAAWQSENFVTCPDLPGWDGPPWSLPLIPGWSRLRGRPVEEIVVEQWATITELLLADLQPLAPGRWAVCDVAALLADPRGVLRPLCRFLEIDYDQALLTPIELAGRSLPAARAATSEELAAWMPRAVGVASRVRELMAAPGAAGGASGPRDGGEQSPFRSVSTASFARTLAAMRSSLIVSTYQSGKLICARDQRGLLNTHFRDFDKPMGIGVAPGRFALATRSEVWDFRDTPAVAGKLDPPGTHDACFIPRNRHLTGDVLGHEVAFAGGELWLVATAFSCLATVDGDHSFVPRWTPPFISRLAAEDRCHLNGVAVRDGAVAFVTALGQTDEPQGWRQGKATGGCVIDVRSGEVVCAGLSMPHSPRWHDDRLWVLESGRGSIATVDVSSGSVETLIELPGFTRGLALAGHLAFVGLSQIRESSTFGDLPLTRRLNERVAGVWIVDLRRPAIAGFLRFEDIVQELFDVALLPGARFPEIAEPFSTAATTSFVLP